MSLQKSMHELSATVHKLSRVMSDYIQRQLELEGVDDLDPSAGAVLLPLLGGEGQTLSELAKSLHMKAPTVTVIANRLEDRGWVRRERGTHDRRQVHLYLTDAGREKAEVLAEIRRKAAGHLLTGVSGDSLARTNDTLKRILQNVESGVIGV